ncbi:MAG: cupin domain-containing protein [Bryobacterales bacterium]|nr:cupin domain-containing protein [Bryobacterales bacterium]
MSDLATPRGAARAIEPTAGPSLTFDLPEQIRELRQEPYWQSGRNAKTLVKYDDLRIVLTAMRANTTIHEHRAAGRISVQTIEGHLRMHAGGREFDLPAGRVLVLDRTMPHDVVALEDSAFLLTIAWPEGTEH